MTAKCLLKRALLIVFSFGTTFAHAGVFDLPNFNDPGQWSLGAEADIVLTKGTGAAFNFKPKYGINDLMNLQVMLGTGVGDRKFRMGSTLQLEWFPDFEKQPGIATPVFIEYYRIQDDALVSFGTKPMIYKTFAGLEDAQFFTPFLAFPLGWNLRDSNAVFFSQIAFGTMFKLPKNDHFKLTVEAGFELKDSYTYISGGMTYFP